MVSQIGFERIVDLLKEQGFEPNKRDKIALLYDESTSIEQVMMITEQLRSEGSIVSILVKGKKLGKQLGRLLEEGCNKAVVMKDGEMEIKDLSV